MRIIVLLVAVFFSSFVHSIDNDLVKSGTQSIRLRGGAESDWERNLLDEKLFADIYEQQAQRDGLEVCSGFKSYFKPRTEGVEFCGAAYRIGMELIVHTHITIKEKKKRGCDLYLEYLSNGLSKSAPSIAVKAVKGALTQVCFRQDRDRIEAEYDFFIIRRKRSLLYPLIRGELRKNVGSFLKVIEGQIKGLK